MESNVRDLPQRMRTIIVSDFEYALSFFSKYFPGIVNKLRQMLKLERPAPKKLVSLRLESPHVIDPAHPYDDTTFLFDYSIRKDENGATRGELVIDMSSALISGLGYSDHFSDEQNLINVASIEAFNHLKKRILLRSINTREHLKLQIKDLGTLRRHARETATIRFGQDIPIAL